MITQQSLIANSIKNLNQRVRVKGSTRSQVSARYSGTDLKEVALRGIASEPPMPTIGQLGFGWLILMLISSPHAY
jgi:hypothetical protein